MARKSRFNGDAYFAPPAARIRERMEKLEMTNASLAREIGVSSAAISQFAKGQNNPTLETLVKIADVFGTSIDYLLERTDDPNIQRSVIDDTGLSDDAVNTLKGLNSMQKKGYCMLSLINSALSYPEFDNLLEDVESYFSMVHAKEIYKHYHDAMFTVGDNVEDDLSVIDLLVREKYDADEEIDDTHKRHKSEADRYYQAIVNLIMSGKYNHLVSKSLSELYDTTNPHKSKMDYIYALKALASLKSVFDHVMKTYMDSIQANFLPVEKLEKNDI